MPWSRGWKGRVMAMYAEADRVPSRKTPPRQTHGPVCSARTLATAEPPAVTFGKSVCAHEPNSLARTTQSTPKHARLLRETHTPTRFLVWRSKLRSRFYRHSGSC